MKSKDNKFSRRNFIKKAYFGATGVIAYSLLPLNKGSRAEVEEIISPRQGLGNLFLKDGKPLLIVAEGDDRIERLKKALDKIGGIEKLVKGKSVILKPNAVAPTPYPVCTEPNFLISIAKIVKDCGAKEIAIYDSVPQRTFRLMGLYEKAKKIGAEAIAVNPADDSAFTDVKKEGWIVQNPIGLSNHLAKADVVINICNIKRHDEAGFTCALKNHFGSVRGSNRWDGHLKLHNGKSIDSGEWNEEFRIPFRMLAAEFADAVRCELNIVDAQDLLTVSGPYLTRGKVKKGINKLIISGDIVATDAYCSKLMAENDSTYKTEIWEPALEHAEKLGLGTANLKNVELIEV
ncbi:MAG: DUF362 domain-containing protein [Candidatus Schekmanbacteria bacterium]|nr:MAG: DUF362 domain-containing protein [Candidatus Schekmanbacteria bacterium]